MKPLTPLQHRIVAASAVAVMIALAGANYAKHGTRASYAVEAYIVTPPVVVTDTTTTSPAITETAPALPPCEALMADLQQGRPVDVTIAPGLTRKYLEPGGGIAETLARAEFLDAFWPGRRLLLLQTRWTSGTSSGDATALIGCEGDRPALLVSASGSPVLHGDVLRVDELESTSGEEAGKNRVRITRTFRVVDDSLRESEPSLRLSEFAPMVSQSGIAAHGYDYALTSTDAIAPMTGRYRVVPETAVADIPEREIILQADGLFLTRHSADDNGPFPVRSFNWGEWIAVHRPDTMPAGTASIHLGFLNRPELVLGWEGDRLTIGDVVYVRERVATPRLWRHGGGDFQTLGGGRWYEKSPDGEFSFIEQSATAGEVELFDPSRNCHVRLTATEATVRCAGEMQWNVYYTGRWESPG